MYTMKGACEATGMSYETLKFYCNQGLLPNVKRDAHNHRVFDNHDIGLLKSLTCLRNCGMSLAEMKEYLALCLGGVPTIPERKEILAGQACGTRRSAHCCPSIHRLHRLEARIL